MNVNLLHQKGTGKNLVCHGSAANNVYNSEKKCSWYNIFCWRATA